MPGEPRAGSVADRLVSFARAGWGAAAGFAAVLAVFAVTIAVRGPGETRQPAGVLASTYLKDFLTERWQERYERHGYILLCAVAPLAAFAAVRHLRAPGWAAAASAAAAVPAAAWACAGLFGDTPSAARLPVLLGVLALPLVWGVGRRTPAEPAEPAEPGYPWVGALAYGVPLAAVLVTLLWPFDLATAGSYCREQVHVASYLVGPALYYNAPGVVPGLDFESHYGAGHAYAFSCLAGGGILRTMAAYVAFLVVVTVLYFLSAFFVLTDWFGRPGAAFLATTVLLTASYDGITLGMPSNWPIRHPFVFAFLFAAVRATGTSPTGGWWAVAAGGVAGLSLFWQTDTGVLTVVSGAALFIASAWFGRTPWVRLSVFGTATAVGFFALAAACFGPRAVSEPFVRRLLEPILLYAGGFGNELVAWRPGWWYLYNLIGPGVALATVGIGIAGPGHPDRPTRYAVLASVLGLGMLFKWVNRSIDVVWVLNAGPVLMVLCWWVWQGWAAAAGRWLRDPGRPVRGRLREAAVLAVVVAAGAWVIRLDAAAADPNHPGGSSSPLRRMRANLKSYPGLYAHWRRPIPAEPWGSPVAADKVAFVRDRTRPDEQVAMISGMDWMYLADADRAPRFHWVPVGMVHSPKLLTRCAEDLWASDRVFVEYGAPEWLREFNPPVYQALIPVLERDFEIVEYYGNSWRVYQRRSVRAAAAR